MGSCVWKCVFLISTRFLLWPRKLIATSSPSPFKVFLCQTNFLHHLLPLPLFSLTAKTGITWAIRFAVALFIHRGTRHCSKWKRLKLKRPSEGKVENLMLSFVLFRGAKPPTCGCFKRIHGCPTLKQPIRDPDSKLRFLVTTTKSSAFMHMSK